MIATLMFQSGQKCSSPTERLFAVLSKTGLIKVVYYYPYSHNCSAIIPRASISTIEGQIAAMSWIGHISAG